MQAFWPKQIPLTDEQRAEQQRAFKSQVPLKCLRCKYRWKQSGKRVLEKKLPGTCPLCHSKKWNMDPELDLTESERMARVLAGAYDTPNRGRGRRKKRKDKPLITGEIRDLLASMVGAGKDGFKLR